MASIHLCRLVASGLAWAFVKYLADNIDVEMKPRRQKSRHMAITDATSLGVPGQALGDGGASHAGEELSDQGQCQRQGRTGISCSLVEALRPDEDRAGQGREMDLHRGRGYSGRLASAFPITTDHGAAPRHSTQVSAERLLGKLARSIVRYWGRLAVLERQIPTTFLGFPPAAPQAPW
jgi:hypothetical protein